MQNIFEIVDSLKDKYVGILEDVVNIESPTSFKAGVDEVGAYFISLAEKNGWEIITRQYEKYGNVVTVIMNKNALGDVITLSGHMDTVHPVGSYGNPPAKIEGDRLYGPGAMDCKGGVVAGFLAMEALSKAGYKERPVMMILQSNEEIGSKETIDYICESAKDSVAFINLEGHGGAAVKTACLKRKGIARYLVEVNGIETHSSSCATEGANAICEASHKIIEYEKIKNNDGLTFNCGVIKGGTTPNTVAGFCSSELDVRFKDSDNYKEAEKIVNEIADTVYVDGCSTSVKQISYRPSMEQNEKNTFLFNEINKAFIKNGLSAIEITERTGGSDASNASSYGIPCIDSVGIGGNGAHSSNEYAYISSLFESAKRIACVIKDLKKPEEGEKI